MRTFHDLTDGEIAALGDEEFRHFLTLERMSRGLVAPAPPELPPVPEAERPASKTVFAIKQGYHFLGAVTNLDVAAGVVRAGLSRLQQDYETGLYYRENSELSIEPIEVADENEILRMKPAIREALRVKKANKDASVAYEKELREYEQTCSDMHESRARCQRLNRDNCKIVLTYDDYVKTCDGNTEFALKFLRRAYLDPAIAAAFTWCGRPVPDGVSLAGVAVEGWSEPTD